MNSETLKYFTERCNFLKYGRCTTAACLTRQRLGQGEKPACIELLIYQDIKDLETLLVEAGEHDTDI